MLVTAFFALQALNGYVVVGWLPTIFSDQGLSAAQGGSLLGLALAVGIPATFALMHLTRSTAGLRCAFVLVGLSLFAGYAGLMIAPVAFPAGWAVLIGLGMGAFPLTLAVIGKAGGTAAETAALSTFAQSSGYLLASIGPFAIGLIRSATGTWTLPVSILILLTVLQLAVSLALTAIPTAGDHTRSSSS